MKDMLGLLFYLFHSSSLFEERVREKRKRHEFMNPRSVTTVIDFAWRRLGDELGFGASGVSFSMYATVCIGILTLRTMCERDAHVHTIPPTPNHFSLFHYGRNLNHSLFPNSLEYSVGNWYQTSVDASIEV